MAPSPAPRDARDRVILALDLSDVDDARRLVDQLDDSISFYKIGYQLGFAGGLTLASDLVKRDKRVFLDLKLLDIDNTVAQGVRSLSHLGASFITVHAYPKTMTAAAEAAHGTDATILAVTVLTSLSDTDLQEAGYTTSAADLVVTRAQQAVAAQVGGLVCSPLEIEAVRTATGDALTLVTPGIRPAGSEAGDQVRIATPTSAIQAGADYLVVGRPITKALQPKDAAQAIVEEVAAAL